MLTLIVAWVVFPCVLVALALGCGMLIERIAAIRIPGALLVPLGMALVIVIGQATTATDATAELTVPFVAGAAVAGGISSRPWRGRGIDAWVVAAALTTFAVYAAPVVFSSEATFTGWIKLDDTASWLAMTDRIMEHGRNLDGLPLSSYQATLDVSLGAGYPVGSFIPLGIGNALIGTDSAWLFQPYMSVMAAMLALTLVTVVAPVIRSAQGRALIAVIAACSALLYGYTMWGGVKEIASAAMLALVAATAPIAIRSGGWGAVAPVAIASTALLAVLGPGAAVWLVPLLVPALVVTVRGSGFRLGVRRAAQLVALTALLSVPLILTGFKYATDPVLLADDEIANLVSPLDAFQLVGIWPSGDFRFDPEDGQLTAVLVVVALLAALIGVAFTARRRGLAMASYLIGALVGLTAIVALASPWVDAKAMATATPAILAVSLVGGVALFESGRRTEGVVLTAALVAGVLGSNVLAYGGVSLAPRAQLAELEEIADQIDSEGPTLMTGYTIYGARHFFRDSEPDDAAGLRFRPVPLADGSLPADGGWNDTDSFALTSLLDYRTLILRQSPSQSRPPSPFRLSFNGAYYQAWQQSTPGSSDVVAHLPLGAGVDPTAVPACAEVSALAGQGSTLVAAPAPAAPLLLIPLANTTYPSDWVSDPSNPSLLTPGSDGQLTAGVEVPLEADYDIWVGGSIRSSLELFVDGGRVNTIRHELNTATHYIWFGTIRLAAGRHVVDLIYRGADLHPGSGGSPLTIGPMILTEPLTERPLETVPSSRARDLCGRRWDWIEVLR